MDGPAKSQSNKASTTWVGDVGTDGAGAPFWRDRAFVYFVRQEGKTATRHLLSLLSRAEEICHDGSVVAHSCTTSIRPFLRVIFRLDSAYIPE